MSTRVLPAYTYACTICMQYPKRPDEGAGSPGTGVADVCELPCGCWEGQPVLSTTAPSLQAPLHSSSFSHGLAVQHKSSLSSLCSTSWPQMHDPLSQPSEAITPGFPKFFIWQTTLFPHCLKSLIFSVGYGQSFISLLPSPKSAQPPCSQDSSST